MIQKLIDDWREEIREIIKKQKMDPEYEGRLSEILIFLTEIDEYILIDALIRLEGLVKEWDKNEDDGSINAFRAIAIAIISDAVMYIKQYIYTGLLITVMMCFSYKKTEKSFYMCYSDFEELFTVAMAQKGVKRTKTIDINLNDTARDIYGLLDSKILDDAMSFTYKNRQKKAHGSHETRWIVEINGLSSTIAYKDQRLSINTYSQGLFVLACPPEENGVEFLEETLCQFILQAQYAQQQIKEFGRPQTKKKDIKHQLPNMKNRSIAASLIIGCDCRSSRGDYIIEMIKQRSQYAEINENLKAEISCYDMWCPMHDPRVTNIDWRNNE